VKYNVSGTRLNSDGLSTMVLATAEGAKTAEVG
jgi:hypothetical protein